MPSLHNLLYSKRPEVKTLLDIALVLSVLPHLFVMKFFMIIYLLMALVFIVKKQKYSITPYVFMLIGIVLIAINFFDDYNFSDLSKMSFFISLISALLLYVVTLQKLTGVINIYLKISPILLMLLSFFFFDSISMLLYSISVFFIFIMMYIWSRMDALLIDVLKKTSQLFLLSMPSVIIMFLVFPRISFDTAEFGFRGETYTTSGYDGTMEVSSNEIRLTDKIIMEVSFEDENISDDSLYFRGSILSEQIGLEWREPITFKPKDNLERRSRFSSYDVTLYPHADRWIYSLDLPLLTPSKAKRRGDFVLRSYKNIYEKKRYELKSALSYKLTTPNTQHYLNIDKTQYPKTENYLKDTANKTDEEKIKELVSLFQDQNLSYTLKPQKIDKKNFTDSFLFEGKNGYCVHFASAFASSARLIGIPSRVITGFKPSKENMMNNYLVVKARDAHAWVELYTKESGWVRFDPTSYASQILGNETNTQQLQEKNTFFSTLNLYYMYMKYTIENWILDYNRLKQLEILDTLINDFIFLMKFLLVLLGSFVLFFLLYLNIKKSKPKSSIDLEMKILLKVLKNKNIIKKEDESMQAFLQRVEMQLGISLKNVDKYYHLLKYSKNKKVDEQKMLKEEISKVLEKL